MAAPDIKAIIFDCFGVLYTDTKQSLLSVVSDDHRQELTDLFASNNYGYFDRQSFVEQVATITQFTTQQVEDYIAAEHHLNEPLVTLINEQLRPAGYKVGLLSNIGRGWMDQFFDEHQLYELFDKVVLSGEEHATKPDPAIFSLMADRLGVEASRCLMIDDIAENCDGAVAAGMGAVQFLDNDQVITDLKSRGITIETI